MSAFWPILVGLSFVGGGLSFYWFSENRPLLARLPLYLMIGAMLGAVILGPRP
jgi:hypothetical protein